MDHPVAETIMIHHGRFHIATLTLAIATLACGGEKLSTDSAAMKAAASSTPAAGNASGAPASPSAAPSAAPAGAPAPATGATHDIQMVGDASGYRFNPPTITIKRGDAVRWTNASGGPHNVTFWPDSIPADAQGQLTANMPNTTAPLTGPLLLTPNQTYTVSFANVAAGTYKYFCTPHLALGMKAVITVQ
jgi:plastocyanin